MGKPCIIIAEHQNWNSCNRRHLYIEMAEDFKIIFVEPKTFFIPSLERWKQWIKALRGPTLIYKNIMLLTPFSFLRFLRFKLIFKLELFLYVTQIKRVLKPFGFSCDILWLCDHMESFLFGKFEEKITVCRIFDDHTQYPGFPQDLKDKYKKDEEKFLGQVDMVFAASQKLYHQAKKVNPKTYYIPNAADFEHFSKALSQDIAVPEDMKDITRPTIGLIGKLNERLDMELLDYIISVKPEWSFVMIGPIYTVSKHFLKKFKEITKKNNVYYMGMKSYDTIPAYLRYFDVCILPYVIGEATEAVNPIKVYEYVVTGKPVVSTPLTDVKPLEDVIKIAFAKEDFARCIADCLANDENLIVEKRLAFARRNTWRARADEITSHILKALNR
ncbi:MAG: glycosyltransferase [Deltaproteobacteria bacterium]|nr:glycosyltransferase [Deltaproteobacteria bacterium]